MPVIFGKFKNAYLPIEDYKSLSRFIIDFVRKAETLGVHVSIDNTIPICMFTPSELGELLLMRVLNLERNFTCFPAIDIGPDLSVWRCFGTSGLFNRRLEEFSSLKEIYEYYESVFRPYQFNVFPMEECKGCKYAKEGLCQGGCIGFSIAKCRELSNLHQEIVYESILDMKPQLSEDMDTRKYEIPEETYMLSHKNKNIIEISSSLKQLLDLFNGKRTIRGAMEIYKGKFHAENVTENILDSFLTNVANEDVLISIKMLLNKEVLTLTPPSLERVLKLYNP